MKCNCTSPKICKNCGGSITKEQLGYVSLFSDRATIQEAYNYALELIHSMDKTERASALTAVQVLHNTWAKRVAEGEI